MFDDYETKETTEYVEIYLKKQDSALIPAWDLAYIINSLSSSYYRLELVNSITEAIHNGINPKNIFILDDNFKHMNDYSNFNILNLEDDGLINLFRVGKPISLFPNPDLYIINLMFQSVERINNELKKYDKSLKLKNLKNYYFILIKTGMKNVLEAIVEDSLKIINKDEELIKELKVIESEIMKIKNDIISSFEVFKYYDQSGLFKEITKALDKNQEIKIKKKHSHLKGKIPQILTTYYHQFFTNFEKLKRPVIGVYYEEEKVVKILCRKNLSPIYNDKAFLDIKEISHRSPTVIILTALATILPIFFSYLTYKSTDAKNKKDMEYLDKKDKREEELHELQKASLLIDVKDKLDKICNKNIENINNIENPFIKEKLVESYEYVRSEGKQVLVKTNIQIDENKSYFIDKRV